MNFHFIFSRFIDCDFFNILNSSHDSKIFFLMDTNLDFYSSDSKFSPSINYFQLSQGSGHLFSPNYGHLQEV